MNNSKRCYGCQQIKPLSDFVKNRSKKDGYGSLCKPCHGQKAKEWRKANPEEQKKRSREQFAKSRQRENARRKKRYEANREEEKLKRKQNYAANAERYRQQARDWRRNNKEKFDAQWRAARARKAAVRTEKYTAQDVLAKWGSICYLCNESIDLEAPRWTGAKGWENGLHLDHVVRISDGGPDTLENVRPTHGLCNLKKH